jgi:hypothetical protein
MIHNANQETPYLGEAVYLVTEGYQLLGTEWRDGALWFIFGPDAAQCLSHYHNSKAERLLDNYRKLRMLAVASKEAHRSLSRN